MVQTRSRITYAEYAKLPEEQRCEVIDGELLMSPAPTPYHQQVLLRLYRLLDHFVRKGGLGEVLVAPCDVVLTDCDIIQPDVFFLSTARIRRIGKKFISGPPDLVMELFTETSAYRDLVRKKKLYAKHGIPEYWLVDLEAKSIEVLAHSAGAYETEAIGKGAGVVPSRLLRGFSVRLRDVF